VTSRTRSTTSAPFLASFAVSSTRARQISEDVEIAAGRAIADVVKPTELSPDYIVPTVFNPNVVKAVAAAVESVLGPTHP
jgi:malic enzyme